MILPGSQMPPAAALVHKMARLLPEYLPGVSTGAAAITEGRACWIQAWKELLSALGREQRLRPTVQEEGDCSLGRQLTLFWKHNDGMEAVFLSGWGDREELERRFQKLEIIKAPLKAIVYSCTKWQLQVLEQFEAALLRYPHHIEGEQYLFLNLLGSEKKLAAYSITISRDGSLQPGDLGRLGPLAGSPFSWGDGSPAISGPGVRQGHT